jgi:hypothetical protein
VISPARWWYLHHPFKKYLLREARETMLAQERTIKRLTGGDNMDWLERMNWPFLEDEEAKRVWDTARRLFFEEDMQLQEAFTKALEAEGWTEVRKLEP